MKTIQRAAIALFAISAAGVTPSCGPAATPTAAQNEATGASQTDTSQKPDAAAAPQGATLTPATLVGRWGDNGDCAKDIVINADGTFTSYTGGSGRWTLNGDRMTMAGEAGTFEVGVELLNQNTLMIRNADGSFGTSQRC